VLNVDPTMNENAENAETLSAQSRAQTTSVCVARTGNAGKGAVTGCLMRSICAPTARNFVSIFS
jgi:hypothetical protein